MEFWECEAPKHSQTSSQIFTLEWQSSGNKHDPIMHPCSHFGSRNHQNTIKTPLYGILLWAVKLMNQTWLYAYYEPMFSLWLGKSPKHNQTTSLNFTWIWQSLGIKHDSMFIMHPCSYCGSKISTGHLQIIFNHHEFFTLANMFKRVLFSTFNIWSTLCPWKKLTDGHNSPLLIRRMKP